MKHLLASTLLSVLLVVANAVWAGDYEDGVEAHEKKDYATALAKFKVSASRGDGRAQIALGHLYMVGQGVAVDYAEAIRWGVLAAEQGTAEAQYQLGKTYSYVELNIKDHAESRIYRDESVKWYRKAAEKGHAEAQAQMGNAYQIGFGIEKDIAKAIQWFKRAAAQDSSLAKINLGEIYYEGIGMPPNYSEALKWNRLSAEVWVPSQNRLSVMYEKGQGIEQNYVLAYMWFSIVEVNLRDDLYRGLYEKIRTQQDSRRKAFEAIMAQRQMEKAKELA